MSDLEFVIMMAAIQAMMALSIDAMLPALGAISGDLGVTDPNSRQLVIGVFLVFSGLASLFPGALADRYGRRPVAVVAIALNVVLSLACAVAGSFPILLVLRAMIGAVSSAMLVLPMTILRDRFEGDKMARMQSMVAMTFMVTPMMAPMLGQAVLLFAGWRWIFAIMAGMGAIVLVWIWYRLPETLHPEYRQPIMPRTIARNMIQSLRERSAIGYFLGAALVQGALFGYLNSSQQLVAEHFGAGTSFPVIFGFMALFMASTNFVNARIVERFGARRVSHSALFAYIAIAVIHLVVAWNGEDLWAFVPLMTLSMCLMGFIGANFQAIALQPFARTAGAAASVMSFIRVVTASVLGAAIGQAFDGTARPILASMLACGVCTIVLVLYSENGRLFRRITPPGYYRQEPPPMT